jgi:tetratricopeptide (TPR) repeat protein
MLALLVMTGAGRGAAPPVSPGWLAGELLRVQQIEARAHQAVLKGDFTRALRLAREVLKARRALLGDQHWQTIAVSLRVERRERLARLSPQKQRQVGAAERRMAEGVEHRGKGRYRQAVKAGRATLALLRQTLGVAHPETALGYNEVASCLNSQGKASEALALLRKALEIDRQALGEGHPLTATSDNNVAFCLNALGKRAEAVRHLRRALLGLDVARHSAAPAGFDRSLFAATQAQPRLLLACLLAREGKHAEAWRHAEAHLARGLLEALSGTKQAEDLHSSELAKLDERIVALLGLEKPTAQQQKERDDLVRQRRALLAAQAPRMAGRLDGLVWSLPRVQKHLRADDALLLWLDAAQEHFACLLRKEGPPRFVPLPGSGKDGRWTESDWRLAGRVHAAVRQPRTSLAEARKSADQLRKQRLAPVEKYLEARGKLPRCAASSSFPWEGWPTCRWSCWRRAARSATPPRPACSPARRWPNCSASPAARSASGCASFATRAWTSSAPCATRATPVGPSPCTPPAPAR